MKHQIDDEVMIRGVVVGIQKSRDHNGLDYIQYIVKIPHGDGTFMDKIVYLTVEQINGKAN